MVESQPARPRTDSDERDMRARLGQVIRQHRIAAGMTLDDLASAAGLHFASLSRVETGERTMSWLTFMRIADALGIALDDLLHEAAIPRG